VQEVELTSQRGRMPPEVAETSSKPCLRVFGVSSRIVNTIGGDIPFRRYQSNTTY